jgi:predicted esterase
VLLRPMVPLDRDSVRHRTTRVLVSSGRHDPIVTEHEISRLIQEFQDMDIQVTHLENDAGHQLTKQELDLIRIWLHEGNNHKT